MNVPFIILTLILIFVLTSEQKTVENFREGSESFKQKNEVPNKRDEAIKFFIN